MDNGENLKHEDLTAEKAALDFLQSIDFKSLGRTVFKDHLATVSEAGKSIGELTVSVEETVRDNEICYYVHAQSHGVLDNVPMGTSVTAYISRGVTTLEQTQHEYIKIPNKPLDKKTVLIKEGAQYTVKRTITEGDNLTEVEKSFPVTAMKGFISEGANIILQRIMCQRQEVPLQMKFIALDATLSLAYQFYHKLDANTLLVEGNSLSIFGIQREQESVHGNPEMTWKTHFLSDGHMASRVTVGSPVRMQIVKLPPSEEEIILAERPEIKKKDLPWQEDMQMHSCFLERKEELVDDHKTYFHRKPEVGALLADFCQFVLLRQPDDVCSFASDYFASFSTKVMPQVASQVEAVKE